MTLQFESDGSLEGIGFDVTVTCIV
eukprot:COSAG01_NODE_52332_length_347_cov_0.838710_2_plen_24_part_01